ncbi:MAG: IS66 family insertion sequence element accessory protein TnpB, partial [Acidobacteriia bacterium]|nr:IS66 family insertion sequence element accessory protein TnpB [Terriglobia bacterium]
MQNSQPMQFSWLKSTMPLAYFTMAPSAGQAARQPGIDSLARLCQEKLQADPFSGCLFVFRSRRGTAIRILVYDGQGFWLAQKRLSKGRFRWWPASREVARPLEAHQLQVLLAAGDPTATQAAPMWRRVSVSAGS